MTTTEIVLIAGAATIIASIIGAIGSVLNPFAGELAKHMFKAKKTPSAKALNQREKLKKSWLRRIISSVWWSVCSLFFTVIGIIAWYFVGGDHLSRLDVLMVAGMTFLAGLHLSLIFNHFNQYDIAKIENELKELDILRSHYTAVQKSLQE